MANEVFKNDPNLQALWLMEEATGATRLDYTANNNDLADNNNVSQSADQKEGTYSADFELSSTQYLNITDGDQTGLDITGDISIVGWAKLESIVSSHTIVGKYNTTGNQRAYWLRFTRMNGDVEIRFNLSSNGTAIATCIGGTALTTGTWYHLAAVYNGTDIRVYLDGSLDSNGASNPLTYSSGIHNSTADLEVGRRTATYYHDGPLDEMAIFDRELSAAEVASIASFGIQEFQELAGTLTSAGAITIQTNKPLAGTLTSAGALVKQAGKPLSGVLSTAGSLVKMTGIPLAGTLTSAGAVVTAKIMHASLAGTLTSAGALVKRAGKPLAGALTSAGVLTKETGKPVAGTLTSAGVLKKETGKPLAGTLTTAGTVVKETAKTFAGTLSSSGVVVGLKTSYISLDGTLTSAGALVKQTGKQVAGTLTSAGAVIKQTSRQVAGTLTSAGAIAKRTSTALAGTLTTAGALAKQTAKAFAGTLTSSGVLDAQEFVASIGPIIRAALNELKIRSADELPPPKIRGIDEL